jgi:hypothetical protein
MLPQLAQGPANKIFIIPSEFSQALQNIGGAIGNIASGGDTPPNGHQPRPRQVGSGPDEVDEKAAADAEAASRAAAEAAAEAAGASQAGMPPGAGTLPPDPDAGPGTAYREP